MPHPGVKVVQTSFSRRRARAVHAVSVWAMLTANSDCIRSGRSHITAFSLSCRAELCHCGTRWSMCLHCPALPSSIH
jgi:hypothetical protein